MGKTNHDAYQTAQKEMIYEPGTIECRILISSKEKIMDIHGELASLNGNLHDCGNIQEKLREIYRELETIHAAIK